jgi:hypothetical protein
MGRSLLRHYGKHLPRRLCLGTSRHRWGGSRARGRAGFCRPPGHHAYADRASGFCYFNNAAIAAEILRRSFPKVAIVDPAFIINPANASQRGRSAYSFH